MKFAWVGGVLCGGLLLAGNHPYDINVNSRYTVESIEVSGHNPSKFSAGLRSEIRRLIGEKFDPPVFDDLARRIRRELHVRSVTHHLLRGTKPEHVRIVYEVKGHQADFDVSVPKFLYHGKQGWSAAVEATTRVAQNSFTFGLVSDGDELPERYAGLIARYENKKVGTDRLWLGFAFSSYHQQWNRTTLEALEQSGEVPGIYRTRQNFQPVATIVLAKPLTLSVGASFQRFQVQFPGPRTQAANAFISALRYRHKLEDAGQNRHEVDAAYTLRAASRALESDFVYVRHLGDLRYTLRRGSHSLTDDVSGGLISGRAPLFERFVLGTSSRLRGWNKFDLDPLGGDRMVHNTVEYRYRWFEIFYDTGAIWNRNEDPVQKHSLGIGLRHGNFFLALAFPLKDGRAEPIFMLGMNY